jgi:hypothetical protein
MRKSYARKNLDRTFPATIERGGNTFITEKLPWAESKKSLPADEFRHMRRALHNKEGVIFYCSRPNHILFIKENLIICL